LNESSVDNDFIQSAVEAYLDMVFRIAYQNTANYSDAEDVTQEVFIKLMKERRFISEEHMKAWLIRVTINLCKDLKKSFWHRRTESLPNEWQPAEGPQASFMDELRRLPKNYRNVLYLYYFEGYTVPEIAKILGNKENTVSSWMTRARKKLKTLIMDGGDGYGHEGIH